MKQDALNRVTCAIRQRYTKQRITGCPWKGHEQAGYPCKNAFDNTVNTGWAFGGSLSRAEITISIDLATVAYIELLFYHDDAHVWEEFEVHIKHDGEWDRDMELTLNMANKAEVVKKCGPRFRIVRDEEGNPKQGAEYKIGFVNGPVHRVDRIFFKVHDTFYDNGNAVLSEVYVYGTKTGQFASTTKDHEGRYLMATQDNLMVAVDSVASATVAQFEMEPLTGGFFAWRNINKLYMACNTDGSLKFSKQTSDEPGVKITIEEQYDPTDVTNIVSNLPIRSTPQTNMLKSCYPEIQGGCSATKKVGWAIKGHNGGGVHNGKTYDWCLQYCCDDPKCKSFDYRKGKNKQCCVSYTTIEAVEEKHRDKSAGPNWSYTEMKILGQPLKTPKGKKRVAFRMDMGGYITVNQQGQLTCNSVTLEDNAIFDLIRPIETGRINKFMKLENLQPWVCLP